MPYQPVIGFRQATPVIYQARRQDGITHCLSSAYRLILWQTQVSVPKNHLSQNIGLHASIISEDKDEVRRW